jgi:hemolysin III
MIIKTAERFSALSHLTGAAAALLGTLVLALRTSQRSDLFLVSLVYGFSVVFLFSASTVYHIRKRSENENSLWRKFDHLAIFFMIAGTYTPLCYLYLEGGWKWGIIIAQWSLVIIGGLFKFFFLKAPRFISAVIYLLMGWMAVIVVGKLLPVMTMKEIILLFAGGILFTIGAVVYVAKFPDPLPDRIGFHGLFHIFIMLGGAVHYLMVYRGIAGELAGKINL